MKIAVILNTNQLGGAERSLIEQLRLSQTVHDFHFFLPTLDSSSEALTNFIRDKGFYQIESYPYPIFLYKLSREFSKIPSAILKSPLLCWYLYLWRQKFAEFNSFYINGNKACLPIFMLAFFLRKKMSMLWHFRDFPSRKAFGIIGKIMPLLISREQRLTFIANSHAVRKDLLHYFPSFKIETLYNLAGALPATNSPKQIRILGIASMFAPWKGLHDVVLTLSLYKKELQNLGIEKIFIFGADIYQTNGAHQSYHQEILLLTKKLKNEMIFFPGIASPTEIFSQLDVLIHPSLEPEPYGRVIIEAFKTQRPVITTGLGGAAELVENYQTGLVYHSFDHGGLLSAITWLCQNPKQVHELTTSAFEKALKIEQEIETRTQQIILNNL